jgi:uncharacterized membrane protein
VKSTGKFKDDWIRVVLGLVPLGFVILITLTIFIMAQIFHPVGFIELTLVAGFFAIIGGAEIYLYYYILLRFAPFYIKYFGNDVMEKS